MQEPDYQQILSHPTELEHLLFLSTYCHELCYHCTVEHSYFFTMTPRKKNICRSTHKNLQKASQLFWHSEKTKCKLFPTMLCFQEVSFLISTVKILHLQYEEQVIYVSMKMGHTFQMGQIFQIGQK